MAPETVDEKVEKRDEELLDAHRNGANQGLAMSRSDAVDEFRRGLIVGMGLGFTLGVFFAILSLENRRRAALRTVRPDEFVPNLPPPPQNRLLLEASAEGRGNLYVHASGDFTEPVLNSLDLPEGITVPRVRAAAADGAPRKGLEAAAPGAPAPGPVERRATPARTSPRGRRTR